MATIRPFRAVRPTNDKVHLVSSRSYVSYDNDQMRDKLKHNPYSFIQIIHPDFDTDDPSEPGTPKRFMRVRERYTDFLNDGIFVRDEEPSFYVYRQTHDQLDCMGIIVAAHADDYRNGKIKVHEQTLSAREALFANYLDITGFNAEPILLTHDDDHELNGWLQGINGRQPDVHFTTADELTHRLWKIDHPEDIEFISGLYGRMPALYIADGHHRSASSVLLADQRIADGRAVKDDAVDHFMAYIIPRSRLVIHGYHRLIKDLGDLKAEELVSALEQMPEVTIRKIDDGSPIPSMRNIDLYLAGVRYRISLPLLPAHVPDADWLTRSVLGPILGITDLRNDERITFEPETAGIGEIQSRVDDQKIACAFFLHSVPFEQLKAVSDRGETMPPKSTWIEPKLRSGLVVYDFTFPDTIDQ